MNKKRKILTLVALISFIVISILVGYGQTNMAAASLEPMQIQYQYRFAGRHAAFASHVRHAGLTPFGTCLSILLVSYIALFTMFADKKAVQSPQSDAEKKGRKARTDYIVKHGAPPWVGNGEKMD